MNIYNSPNTLLSLNPNPSTFQNKVFIGSKDTSSQKETKLTKKERICEESKDLQQIDKKEESLSQKSQTS